MIVEIKTLYVLRLSDRWFLTRRYATAPGRNDSIDETGSIILTIQGEDPRLRIFSNRIEADLGLPHNAPQTSLPCIR